MKLTDFILSDANLILLHILISGVIVSNVDFFDYNRRRKRVDNRLKRGDVYETMFISFAAF